MDRRHFNTALAASLLGAVLAASQHASAAGIAFLASEPPSFPGLEGPAWPS